MTLRQAEELGRKFVKNHGKAYGLVVTELPTEDELACVHSQFAAMFERRFRQWIAIPYTLVAK